MTNPFQVVLGGVHVYDGSNYMQARCLYTKLVKRGNQPVTLFHNGKIKAEYFPRPTLSDSLHG